MHVAPVSLVAPATGRHGAGVVRIPIPTAFTGRKTAYFWRCAMTMFRSTLSLAIVLTGGGVLSAGEFKSGPQVGDGIDGRFKLLCANGTYAGKACCPV
jgi:hypothetical protein